MKDKKPSRPIPGLSREDEEKQLSEIIAVAQRNLMRTEHYIKQLSEELYDLMETYETKDKEGLALFHNTQSRLHENERDLLRCRKARKKPYFGRIDFKDPRQPWAESYYVGRVGISENGVDPLVIDWRAPVASVYYENAIGPCSYLVKNEGRFEIDLKRKRTYEIADDQLKDFYDSDVVANDELLTQYLAKNKKAVLGEIIATIQKEQNAIIRQSPKTNLIVQGVAGSGKTTVAMHRISYILYNYEQFRPEDFYIIGSNRILLDYITSVLPELDVYGVSQMTMEQLFVRLLYEDWDPKVHHICAVDQNADPQRISKGKKGEGYLKGSYGWFHDLEQFCERFENEVIPKAEIRIHKNGILLLEESAIKEYLASSRQVSMQGKIRMLNEILLSRLDNELSGKYVSYSLAEKKELRKMYRWHFGKENWKGSIFEVYRQFLQMQEADGKAVPVTENDFDVYDLAALAYLYKRIKETDGIREASHVIIDEAQDFGMMVYGALAYCLRGCTYTIMGDVSQNIHFGYGLNDWEELRTLILTGTYDHFGLLKKSYRNTVEIARFATEILRHGNFAIYPSEPINRHGNGVCVIECSDEEAMIQETVKKIQEWQKQGRETVAVICRDEAQVSTVNHGLRGKISLADSHLETVEYGNGVMVLPVEYTKGLEFDAVVIYHPSTENYPAQDKYVKLLYVAATRALHELAVVHCGDLTELIGRPVSEEKRMQSLEQNIRKEAKQYAKKETTAREQELLQALQGEKERVMRTYMGPKPIAAQPVRNHTEVKKIAATPKIGTNKTENQTKQKSMKLNQTKVAQTNLNEAKAMRLKQKQELPVNGSPYRFGECPDNHRLQPRGHSRIDNSVRMVRKTKRFTDLISSYGTLRITPIEDEVIRIQFKKGSMAEFSPGYWNYKSEKANPWTIKEGRNIVEIATAKLLIRIERKTGALQFYNRQEKLLLAEKALMPRQVELNDMSETWTYFDWPKNEKIFVKGILADDLERINQKARYISFGGKKLRMPLLISEYGYGIAAASDKTVMCCTIAMYGTYLYTEGTDQIDYYFLYGSSREKTLNIYQTLTCS